MVKGFARCLHPYPHELCPDVAPAQW